MNQAAAPASADAHMLVPRPGQPAARARWLRVSAGLWAGTVLAAVATVAMTVVAWGNLTANDGFSELSGAVAAVTYATLGALIVRRAGNLIGWIMMGVGAGLAFLGVASAYAVIGAVTYPGAVPAPKLVGLLAECSFVPCTFTIAFMFLLFPSGKLPSRRWRPLAAAGLVLAGLTLSGLAVRPRLVQIPAPGGTSLTFQNPLGVAGLWPVLRVVLVGTLSGMAVVFVAFLAASIVSLAVRYRAGGPLQRQQIKWLAMTALMLAVFLVIASAGHRGRPGWPGSEIRCLHGCADHRLLRDPGRDDDRDSPAPAVRHRRDHQPGGGLRPAVGRIHGRVRGHRAGHRHVRRAPRRPGAHGRRGGLHRPAVPAAAAPLPAVRQPAGVRRAGHAVSGAVRLRRGHGRAAGLRRGPRQDGVAAGRRDRGHPGRGVDPDRSRAAPRRDLAARVTRAGPRRRSAATPGCPPSTPRRARCRSGTATSCSARCPCESQRTSR